MMSFVQVGLGVTLFGLAMTGCAVDSDSGAGGQAGDEQADAPANEATGEAEEALQKGSGPTGSGSVCDAQCHVLMVNCQLGGYAACIPWTDACKVAVDNACTGGAYATCMTICRNQSGTVGGGGVAH
jgi:hypothetical protein